jgi:hypothetical protein
MEQHDLVHFIRYLVSNERQILCRGHKIRRFCHKRACKSEEDMCFVVSVKKIEREDGASVPQWVRKKREKIKKK